MRHATRQPGALRSPTARASAGWINTNHCVHPRHRHQLANISSHPLQMSDSSSPVTNVYALGASRNIGYYASLRLLKKGATVTFLLRNLSVFDEDAEIQSYIKAGKARLVKGDALNREDVAAGWTSAGQVGPIDLLLFTVGGTPNFSLRHGLVLATPDLCTRSILNALSTLPRTQPTPRIVVVTSTGLSDTASADLPYAIRALYTLLHAMHADKLGAERVLLRVQGSPLPADKKDAGLELLPAGWESIEGLPAEGALPELVIVRPALLTDGACCAESGNKKDEYRIRAEGDKAVPKGYTISRRDVAHFIVERLLGSEWDTYKGKGVSLAY
ncbi:hypothetical protein EVG20_g8112 [Dentipellis fragilis]|uniref:Uncharacterized protein n=1 Tax=Dentipellis fragilis TaxID=205917 RepID=A0A4Y9Y943_9AGAM|nr:hypothetical protein EVG20_g8112 [Dentipellis fragilis]